MSSKNSSAVSDERQPCFSNWRATFRPGFPFSTMNSEMPRLPFASGSVRAATMKMSPYTPLVMKVLEPLSTQPPSDERCARVLRPATSEPAFGSVTHTAPTFSPAQAAGRYFSFCSCVPRCAM
ncbi:hypothetical protein D3C85_1205140 [compost metagenome]